MHENRHFLSYQKCRRDAEKHRRTMSLWGVAAKWPVADLEKIEFDWISKDQRWSSDTSVSSWAFVYFLLVISSFLNLVRRWRFSLFRFVYSSFHNRLDLIRELAFYWVFILFSQFILVCFIVTPGVHVCLFQAWMRWQSVRMPCRANTHKHTDNHNI